MSGSLIWMGMLAGMLGLGVLLGLQLDAWRVRHYQRERDAAMSALRRHRSGEMVREAYLHGREAGASDAVRKVLTARIGGAN